MVEIREWKPADPLPVSVASSDLLNALARGIFASNLNTAYQCPTGNCTWPAFNTLGICSSCKCVNTSEACDAVGCVYKSYYPDPFGSGETLFGSANAAAANTLCNGSSFVDIAVVHRDQSAKTWGQEPAFLCTLSFCRKTYNATNFTLAVLHDEPTESTSLVSYPQATPPVGVNSTGLCSYRIAQSKRQDHDEDVTFWVNPDDVASMGAAAEPFFWTSLVTTLGANQFVASALSRDNGGHVPLIMDAVAQSMTNQIRQGPNATSHLGQSDVPQVYIYVTWYWLILPSSIVFLAVAFLAVVSKVPSPVVWKSSTLASLFHSVHGSNTKEASLRSRGQMDAAAAESYALLRQDSAGSFSLAYVHTDVDDGDEIPIESLGARATALGRSQPWHRQSHAASTASPKEVLPAYRRHHGEAE